MFRPTSFLSVVAAFAVFLAGCGGERAHDHSHEGHDHGHEHADHSHEGHDHGEEGHVHLPPRGGALVALGEEFAHLEFVLDFHTGKLTAYVLDGHAENAVRIAQETIEVTVQLEGATPLDIALQAVGSSLTGERVGDTSEFSADVEALRGAAKFTGTIKAISVKGQEFSGVSFKYPEGNEQ